MPIETRDILLKTLKSFWGYNAFRESQEDIILSILEQNDTLALLPTGGGKSLCYQLPALVLEGTCLVISPLLALMKDQVSHLKDLGIEAEYLSSELDEAEQEEIYEKAISGEIKLLYVSPERLHNSLFMRKMLDISLSFIAVDEAHCISEWGQDFRPSYQHISEFRKTIGNLPCLALTATATPKVVLDIKEKLGLSSVRIFQKSYKRENIHIFHEEVSDKYQRMLSFLKINKISGIVYVRTRREAEELMAFLKEHNLQNVDFYHAGLSARERNEKQRKWQERNDFVLISTNAFGMGIDKDNVRFVIHYSPSSSVENYYQEIGRAGRDGQESYAFLLWNKQELGEMDDVLSAQIPDKTQYLKVISYIYSIFQIADGEAAERIFQLDLQKVQSFTKISFAKIRSVLGFLHNQEVIFWNNYKSPSTIELKIPAEELEDLPPKDAYFIELLLRNVSGVATHKVSFSEESLSAKLGVSQQMIKDRIKELQKKEWLEYVDGSTDSIKFLRPRDSREIQGKYWNLFEKIQRNKIQKWEEMKYFIQDKDFCKMRMILTYFGEKSSDNCGKCSFCLSQNPVKEKTLSDEVLEILAKNPATFDELSVKIFWHEKEKIYETLITLLNLEKIKMLNYKTYMINE